jgi:hypothetical protein
VLSHLWGEEWGLRALGQLVRGLMG